MPIGDRLHSWAGMVPLAGYLVVHLLTQASALWGPRAHLRWASPEPRPAWAVLEIALIYLPLLVHVALGVRRIVHRDVARSLVARPVAVGPVGAGGASAASALGPLLQLLSGAVLLAFLLSHLAEFRLRVWMGVLAPSDYYPELCASLSSTRWGGIPMVAIGYLMGLAAGALHGAYGLYRGALSLGLVAAGRERRWGRCCSAFGLGVFGLGALIVIDLATGSVLIDLGGS